MFLVVLLSAIANLFTKPIATVSGICFSAHFLRVCGHGAFNTVGIWAGEHHEHKEQFNRAAVDELSADTLGLSKPYRKLVAIRSPHNLFMLEKALLDNDPVTTRRHRNDR